MIKTKSIYAYKEQEDWVRILITRWHPRNVKKENYNLWLRELSPSAELLKKHKNGTIEWNDFLHELLGEFRKDNTSIEAIHMLHEKSKSQTITLLCYEKEGHSCHRYMVKELIENPKLLTDETFIPK